MNQLLASLAIEADIFWEVFDPTVVTTVASGHTVLAFWAKVAVGVDPTAEEVTPEAKKKPLV